MPGSPQCPLCGGWIEFDQDGDKWWCDTCPSNSEEPYAGVSEPEVEEGS